MPWQKITRHINGSRIEVESKSGNRYPAETEYDHMNDGLYRQLVNDAHDGKEYWAWINFDGDNPVVEDWTRKADGQGPPENPPWKR